MSTRKPPQQLRRLGRRAVEGILDADLAVDKRVEPPLVTAEEWLAAHEAEASAEDQHRKITDDHELSDVAIQRDQEQKEVASGTPVAESPEPDIRQQVADEGRAETPAAGDRARDEVRTPSADETAESVRRAQQALRELVHRQAVEARHAQDEANDEASRWHADKESRATGDRAQPAWLKTPTKHSSLGPLSSDRFGLCSRWSA